MDNVIININTGAAPFHIEIDTNPIQSMEVNSTGQYAFMDIPSGVYTITVTDSLNCVATLNAVIGNPPSPSVYSAEFISHNCAQEETIPYLTGLTVGVNYSNCTTVIFPRYNWFLSASHITDFASNYPSTDIEYFEVMGYESEDSRMKIHYDGTEVQVGDRFYVNSVSGEFTLGDLEVYITEAIPDSIYRRIQLRYKLRYFDSISNSAWFRYELDGCPEWTTL